MAYVGKINDGEVFRAARLQISQPGAGFYASSSGLLYYRESGGTYLYNNPKYSYYWIDSSRLLSPPNAVYIPTTGPNSYGSYVTRLQVNGQTHVANAFQRGGMYYVDEKGAERNSRNYQVLVCDPKPANPCSE
jgi:hypothetical protein